MSIAAALPWWLSVVLAGVSFLGLRWIAVSAAVPAPSGLENIDNAVVMQMIRTVASVAQFVVPIAIVAGAAVSGVRQIRGGRLLAAVASDAPAFGPAGQHSHKSAMTWRDFEILVHELYRRQGYRVTETGSGADGGVDLVLRRGGERYFVQCKHWQAKKVSVKIVRELKGVIAQAGVSGGAMVTSGQFSSDALEFALKAGIDLVDGRDLALFARALHGEARTGDGQRVGLGVPPSVEPSCPKCGSSMMLRQARRGPNAGGRFWGCTRFPACRGTVAHTAAVEIQ